MRSLIVSILFVATVAMAQEAAEDPAEPKGVSMMTGVGSRITGPNAVNYSINNNTLSVQGVGRSMPEYLVGASVKLYNSHTRKWCMLPHKESVDNSDQVVSRRPYYVPTSLFVNLQFAPGTNNVLNGYTLGGGYSIKNSPVEFLVGYSLIPNSEPSSGFLRTAALAVKNNPAMYPTFNSADILANKPGALDGFSTVQNGTALPLYPGNILTTRYRSGLFIGFGFRFDPSKLFK
jgi:hypothetical protein